MDQNQTESLHTGVTKDTASTPGYFRMFVPGIMARYVLRSAFAAMKEVPGVSWLDRRIVGQWEPLETFAKDETNSVDLRDKAARELKNFKPLHVEEELQQLKKDPRSYRKKFFESSRAKFWDAGYDTSLGIGSLLLTTAYALRVKSDMKSVFAETVAFETGKKPSEIGFRDLAASDNVIVRSTVNNFVSKNLWRYATDLVFFGRHFAKIPGLSWMRVIPSGDMGVGVKGAVLLNEIMAKKSTMFEDLVQLIDKKLNPIKGIGDPISTAEVIDLYQKYALQHHPDAAFRDATIRQRRDGIDWEKTNPLFSRVADLMNQTYKYKHSSLDHVPYEERELAATSDFALPKFLYLLGHGLIDVRRPEESLAYVEIANRKGIEAVKTVRQQVAQGMPFREALKPYGVEMRRHAESQDREAAEKESTATPNRAVSLTEATSIPETKVQEMAHLKRLTDQPQLGLAGS